MPSVTVPSTLTPSPATVAETIAAMIDAPWPTAPEQAREWLRRHRIDPDSGTARDDGGTSHSRDHVRTTGWGDAVAGWGEFADEFVGVHWFLWSGAPSEDVMGGALALVALITQQHGSPTEAIEDTEHGGTWLWRLPGHVTDLYAYHGLPRADGYPAGPACVQLHVDHRDRSEAREREARARHEAERADPDWEARLRAEALGETQPPDPQ